MREIPKPYEVYKHFKGNIYQIISIALDSETLEQVVVYQQLYSPFQMYVRPLEMFLSKTDKDKYPDAVQEYRFEKLEKAMLETDVKVQAINAHVIDSDSVEKLVNQEEEKALESVTVEESAVADEEFDIDPNLLRFLESDSCSDKLELLHLMHATITDAMIDTMAMSLDFEIQSGDIEQRYQELLNCLLTKERFECARMR
ncbi:MAG: DUF1653 domain-containing protein [Lachnospiraceae bacterium]|nr:DUF1653 domain-containing protein [Lachnospiraceae bacterium]